MPTTDRKERHPVVLVVAAIVVTLAIALVVRSLISRPQIGSDAEVFKTVDALFTAITSRDQQRLDDCERRLRSFQEGGKLPIAAAKQLQSIIQQARSGQWDASARKLYDFMLAQRGPR